MRWGQGSTVYSCLHCGRYLESAWQVTPGHPNPRAFEAGRQVWRHRRTRARACSDLQGVATPA